MNRKGFCMYHHRCLLILLMPIMFCISLSAQPYPPRIFILIHGTWASDTDWHLPGGPFFDELEKSCDTCGGYLVSYNWSGRLNHESRLQAARGLLKLLQSY